MKALERSHVDRLVRQLEAGAYHLALESLHDPERAGDALVDAFGRAAPFFPRLPAEKLKATVDAAVRRRVADHGWSIDPIEATAALPVPGRLHTQLVDVVEERQNDEPLGRRRLLVAALAGAVLLLAGVGYAVVRIDALAAAKPVVAATIPLADATEVPVQGTFTVRFAKLPSAKPTLSLTPADGSLDQAIWAGGEVIVDYGGLRLAKRYTLTVEADYRSTYNDLGHFVQQWRFTTEGYPILVRADPADGTGGVFRNGELSLVFNHRPPVVPTVTLTPSDGSVDPGRWIGSTWTGGYSGLKPLTAYTATVVVNYGVPRANIHQRWSFTTEVGAPPAGVPIIWYALGSRNTPLSPALQRLIGLDWTGNTVGTGYAKNPLRQNWDGSLLMDQSGSIDDVSGNLVKSTGTFPAIADDSRTLCELADADGTPGASPQWLFAGPVTGPLRRIGPVAGSSVTNYGLIGCSVGGNRALLSQGQMRGISSMSVLSLSTGRLLYQHEYPVYPSAIIPSRDCRYVAEQIPTLNAQGVVTLWVTSIRRLSDGAVVAQLPNQNVLAFSWDDRRVVTVGAPGMGRNEIDVLDWQSGRVLWRLPMPAAPNSYEPAYATAEPNGSRLAVAVGDQTTNGETNQLWLVSADGSAKPVLSSITFYAMFFFAY